MSARIIYVNIVVLTLYLSMIAFVIMVINPMISIFVKVQIYYKSFVIIINQKIDIDECTEGTSGCDQDCSNILGSYECSCERGYLLDSDNHTCTDIDECIINNGGCEQSCINTNGGYYCTCDVGYVLNDDRHQCDGKLIYTLH